MRDLRCEMSASCQACVTHIDNDGYVYCEPHGLARRIHRPCRKLRPHELTRLRKGLTISYEPKPRAPKRCDQCASATINGVFSHELGCPNRPRGGDR